MGDVIKFPGGPTLTTVQVEGAVFRRLAQDLWGKVDHYMQHAERPTRDGVKRLLANRALELKEAGGELEIELMPPALALVVRKFEAVMGLGPDADGRDGPTGN